MPRRRRQWYVESLDSFTGAICAKLLDVEEAELRKVHGPRPKHLWPCAYDDIKRLQNDKVNLGLKFAVWAGLEGDKPRRFYSPKEKFKRDLRLVPT